MKIAVALIVKNEAADILTWIAWYVLLGVDTLIIFDDGSTDGTELLVRDASKLHDIRLFSTTKRGEDFTVRQKASYITTLKQYRDEFDWIGFLDSDEYVSPESGTSIKSILAQAMDRNAGAVAIHWCNYGSNGHVLTPTNLSVAAYTRHASLSVDINRHIKSFVRPEAWTGHWLNVHYFEVAPYRYLLADGSEPVWSANLGITATKASWAVAKIMHFQCRSMEHFVDRIRKRPDIRVGTSTWLEHDMNHEVDERPLAQLAALEDWIAGTVPYTLRRILDQVAGDFDRDARLALSGPSRSSDCCHRGQGAVPFNDGLHGEVQAHLVQTYHGTLLEIDRRDRTIRACGSHAAGDSLVVAVQLSGVSQQIFLLTPGLQMEPLIDGDRRLAPVRRFRAAQVEDEQAVALQHPETGCYLSAEPPELRGLVSAKKREANGWEMFKLVPIARTSIVDRAIRDGLGLIETLCTSADRRGSIGNYLRNGHSEQTASLLPVWLELLDSESRQSIMRGLSANGTRLV